MSESYESAKITEITEIAVLMVMTIRAVTFYVFLFDEIVPIAITIML